jgi:hypothetical protein
VAENMALNIHNFSPNLSPMDSSPIDPKSIKSDESYLKTNTEKIRKGIKRSASEVFSDLEQSSPGNPKRAKEAQIEILTDESELGKIGRLFEDLMDQFTRKPPFPWNDTDLIICHEKFGNALPLNMIEEAEFEKINQLFSDICEGKSVFEIKGDDGFRKDILEMFKKIF